MCILQKMLAGIYLKFVIPWFPVGFSFVPITNTRGKKENKKQEFKEARICIILNTKHELVY